MYYFQEGMRQHFELGQFLRNRYKGFLNESYDRHEVGVFISLSDHVTPRQNLQRLTMTDTNVKERGALAMLLLFNLVLESLEHDGGESV